MRNAWTAIGLLTLSGTAASGAIIDLTTGQFGTANGARFERADFRPAGTGVINSFVRISANEAVVRGYNTSGRPLAFHENTSPQFTRDLTFGAVPTIKVDGVVYKEFMLDINQQAAEPLLSLDQVQIYASETGGQTTSNVSSLGALVFDIDAGGDNWVKLDYNLGTGSGQGDMRLLVPVSAFGTATAGTFIYLYSVFGENHANNDGYEEWAVFDSSVVPLPPAVFVGLSGLFMAGIVRRLRAHR
jgi:hypothetical protein